MKCRICGRDRPPRAKLCLDCRAARKRAFAATVTEPTLLAAGAATTMDVSFVGEVAKQRKARSPRRQQKALERPVARPVAGVSLASRIFSAVVMVIFVGGVALATYRWFALQPAADSQAALDPVPARSDVSLTAASTVVETMPVQPAPAESPISAPASSVTQQHPNSGYAQEMNRRNGRPRTAPKPDTKMPVPPSVATASEPPPVIPSALAAPLPASELRHTDPLGLLSDGLARCAREDWLSRPSCEDRTRREYCEGYWGRVEQCPIGPTVDHGQ